MGGVVGRLQRGGGGRSKSREWSRWVGGSLKRCELKKPFLFFVVWYWLARCCFFWLVAAQFYGTVRQGKLRGTSKSGSNGGRVCQGHDSWVVI